jgi:hypothetical protein
MQFPWHLFALIEAQASTEIETGRHVPLEELLIALLPKRQSKKRKSKAQESEAVQE